MDNRRGDRPSGAARFRPNPTPAGSALPPWGVRILPLLLALLLAPVPCPTGCPASPAPRPPFSDAASTASASTAAGRLPERSGARGGVGRAGGHLAGESPDFARRQGWPVRYPQPLPGAILPQRRIVAYYGNPLSKRMGVLGEYPREVMLARLKREMLRWEEADPAHPVQPALHLITVVAQESPGRSEKYRLIVPDRVVRRVYGWAKEAGCLLFLDIQSGHDNIRTLLPRFERMLKNPDVHLGMDPEFNLGGSGARPGSRIGTYDAADVNFASGYLAELVRKHRLPPKLLVVHRFTRNALTNYRAIILRPEVQIVINMDGWGPPRLKRDSYRDNVVSEPVQFTGFKLFYRNDTRGGHPLLTPRELLRLNPQPLYIQYQ